MTHQDFFALDQESVRKYDDDGHMRVETANISKAGINKYLGREVPGWQSLGLDENRTYNLFRDPNELAKAAPTFRGKPLLITHTPATPDAHPFNKVVGAVGDNVVFDAPYLKSSLTIWPEEALDGIESGEQRELSSSYRYKPVLENGIYEGEPYDIRMTDIAANHVAIVRRGRAGPDVYIGDSEPDPITEKLSMTDITLSRKATLVHGATLGFIKPLLAADGLPDLSSLFAGVNSANYVAARPRIVGAIAEHLNGKLGKDKTLDALPAFLAAFDSMDPAEECEAKDDAMTEEERKAAEEKAAKDKRAKDEEEAKAKAEKDKDDKKAGDDEEEEKKKDEAEKAEDSKRAMDSAVAAAVAPAVEAAVQRERARARALIEAKDIVEGSFGKVRACDSAEDYYRAALTSMEVKGADKLDPSVLKPMVESLLDARGKIVRAPRLVSRADDAKPDPKFPHAGRLQRRA